MSVRDFFRGVFSPFPNRHGFGRLDKLSGRKEARSSTVGTRWKKGQRNGRETDKKRDRNRGDEVRVLAELSQLKVNYLSAKTTEFQSADE